MYILRKIEATSRKSSIFLTSYIEPYHFIPFQLSNWPFILFINNWFINNKLFINYGNNSRIKLTELENLVCKFVRNLGNEIIKNTCFVNDQLESWNGIIPNPIFKYSIGYSNSNFIFLVKNLQKASAVWIYSFIFKDFYLKNILLNLSFIKWKWYYLEMITDFLEVNIFLKAN